MKIYKLFLPFIALLLGLMSCSSDDNNNWTDDSGSNVISPQPGANKGLYILSEGKWGSNKALLTYYNYDDASFINDYFVKINPEQGGLGDVGNDLKIYGDRLYAVINNSNYIEVMNAKTAKHIGKITIPNCRYIAFDGNYGYVSSFASFSPGGQGYVAKIDLQTLSIVSELTVGFQPEELTTINNKLYVTSSGGYPPGTYDTRVYVIDLNTFTETKKITVGPNLWRIKTDKNNNIWVTSRGDYMNVKPSISVINPNTDTVTNTLNITVTDFDFYKDNLYFYGIEYNNYSTINSYGIIDVNTKTQTSSGFINNSSDIMVPYGIAVDQDNGDIFIGDALDYVSEGKIYCFNENGSLKWYRTVGVSPGHFAFMKK